MSKTAFCCAILAWLALGAFFLGFSGSVDDAHITFWAAQVLGSEGQILNYNFDRVEQSSTLLQVSILAFFHFMTGLPVVTIAHVLTAVASLLALFFAKKVTQDILPAAASTSVWLLASAPFFVYWSFSGMESPWLAMLLLLLLIYTNHWLQEQTGLFMLAIISLSAQMARPEMPLVLCVFALALFPVRYLIALSVWRWQKIAQFLFLQVVCAALLTCWRWWYFQDVLPQPVRAKTGGALLESIQQGLLYVQQTWFDWRIVVSLILLVAGIVLAIMRAKKTSEQKPLLLLLVILLMVYCSFVIASGGDWMAAGRFWVPIMPLASVLIAIALQEIFINPRFRRVMLSLLIAGNVAYLWQGSAIDFNGVPLWKNTKLLSSDSAVRFSFFERHAREHLHDIPTLAFSRPLLEKLIALRKSQGNVTPVNFMAGQMGMVPFYLASDAGGRVRFFDRNGIVERTLTHCHVADGLPRTRNGIGTGYAWIVEQRAMLEAECGFVMPDIIFDIETGWNRRNIEALQQAGYVFIYRQRGHVFNESVNELLPLRKIGAGQFIAITPAVWDQLGKPEPVERIF